MTACLLYTASNRKWIQILTHSEKHIQVSVWLRGHFVLKCLPWQTLHHPQEINTTCMFVYAKMQDERVIAQNFSSCCEGVKMTTGRGMWKKVLLSNVIWKNRKKPAKTLTFYKMLKQKPSNVASGVTFLFCVKIILQSWCKKNKHHNISGQEHMKNVKKSFYFMKCPHA